MAIFKKKLHITRRNLLLVAAFLIAAIGVIFLLEKRGVINLYTQDISSDNDAETTSKEPSAQPDFKEGDDRQAGSTIREDEGSATVVDNSGSIDETINKSKPTTSETGEITVYEPVINALVKDQIRIAGTSTLPTVIYRIVDSVSGVVSIGELSVVNGQFSGSLKIDTGAEEGRLDVFARKADGNEFSNVAIPLRFR